MRPSAAFASRSPPQHECALVELRSEVSYQGLSVGKFVIASPCSLND